MLYYAHRLCVSAYNNVFIKVGGGGGGGAENSMRPLLVKPGGALAPSAPPGSDPYALVDFC